MPKLGRDAYQLPDREVDICLRIRQIRTFLKKNQVEFASDLGITRDRLASYEYARAPVKYWLGDTFCKKFLISQRWLATGKEPQRFHVKISDEITSKIENNDLFSEVYEEHLKQIFESPEGYIKRGLEHFPKQGAKMLLNQAVDKWTEGIDETKLHEFYNLILHVANSYIIENSLDKSLVIKEIDNDEKIREFIERLPDCIVEYDESLGLDWK